MSGVPADFARILEDWQPRPQSVHGDLGVFPAQALAALLGGTLPEEGAELPPLWSEVYLRQPRAMADLGPDGHPCSDALVPPLTERRRMFGGGRVIVTEPLRVGERATRRSSVKDVRTREGRSGWLLLVTEVHDHLVGDQLRVSEQRDIVYRLPGDVAAAPRTPAPADAEGGRVVYRLQPDERMLFSFSALTYNAHRIHYDHRYAVEVEGHRDLLVHGPLLGIGAIEAAIRVAGGQPATVVYRLLHPCFPTSPVEFALMPSEGDRTRVLGVQDGLGIVEASVTWS